MTAKGEKVHIIENEFAGLSIDAKILEEEHCDVSQITGGCMCCTGRTSFQNLLLSAAEKGYDRVLVEPSGIYDANQFFSVLLTEPVCTCCTIGNIITIVDSLPDDILSDEARALMFSQLIYTGCIVMSKTQLRKAEEMKAAMAEMQAILGEYGSDRDLIAENNCFAKAWDELNENDFAAISSCGYRRVEYSAEVIRHADIFSSSMFVGKFDTMEHLQTILHDLLNTEKYGKIYRIKGYIADMNRKWYELNCSASGCFVREAHVKRGLFIVIGQNYDESTLRALFQPPRTEAK